MAHRTELETKSRTPLDRKGQDVIGQDRRREGRATKTVQDTLMSPLNVLVLCPCVCGESTPLAVLGQTGHLLLPTVPALSVFGWLCACRMCGLGNEPGEAVELRLKQRWINHFSLWAGEPQLAWGHKH